jgi:hypothetical protein
MGEVKTEPVAAHHMIDRDQFLRESVAGAIFVQPHEDGSGEVNFWYRCPCGCGAKAFLLAGRDFKPADSPSWNWNGSLNKATLTPSVHHVGHWHGWLTDGVWRSC